MKSEPKLGELIYGEAQRDAIHIAISPVVAGEYDLRPGMLIGFDEPGCEVVRHRKDGIGIVDPFLKEAPQKGQRFWMFLYPGTITSLRHEWTHPAFVTADEKSESRLAVERIAVVCGKTYEALMDDAQQFADHGNWIRDNSERYKDADWDEFWKHFEILTGIKTDDLYAPYDCSC